MISFPLLKNTIKTNVKMWIILTGTLMLLMVAIFFVGSNFSSSGDIVIQQFYTLFAALIPLIYITSTANKLIAQKIDNGSLAYIMSNPIKRNKVSMTQAIFLIGSIVLMYIMITLTGLVTMLFLGEVIALNTFFLLNLGSMLLMFSISGIAFVASCFFNTSRHSLAIGAGIPVAFLLLKMLSDFSTFSENMAIFKYLTLNTLFNVNDIISGSSHMIWQFSILFSVALISYIASIMIFKRKDLPL